MPELTCRISNGLWDALHQHMAESGEPLAHAVSTALADYLGVKHGTLFQV